MDEPTGSDTHRVTLACGHEEDVSLEVDPEKAICGDCRVKDLGVIEMRRLPSAYGLLDDRAKKRLRNWYLRSSLSVPVAQKEIDARRRAEGSRLSLSEYMTQGQALIDYTHAKEEVVRLVLPELIREWRAIGLSGQELSAAASMEVQSFCNYYQIPEDSRFMLEMEFVKAWWPDAIDVALAAECERPEDVREEPKDLRPAIDPIVAEGGAVQSPIRKRGRPRPRDALFDKALEEKAAGKRNKEVLKGLDNNSDPTSAQARGLSVRLKNYLRGRKK